MTRWKRRVQRAVLDCSVSCLAHSLPSTLIQLLAQNQSAFNFLGVPCMTANKKSSPPGVMSLYMADNRVMGCGIFSHQMPLLLVAADRHGGLTGLRSPRSRGGMPVQHQEARTSQWEGSIHLGPGTWWLKYPWMFSAGKQAYLLCTYTLCGQIVFLRVASFLCFRCEEFAHGACTINSSLAINPHSNKKFLWATNLPVNG